MGLAMIPARYNFSECRSAVEICATCPCTISLTTPLYVARATDSYLSPTNSFTATGPVSLNGKWILRDETLRFGQDITFGTGGTIPSGTGSQGSTSTALISQMQDLRDEVAHADSSGKSQRLMNAFTAAASSVALWEDADYDSALAGHANINHFMEATLNAPGQGAQRAGGKLGLHQKLLLAGMDISAITTVTDLGVPALNLGSKFRNTEDWGNGLAFMANGIQYVYVYVTDYCYNQVDRAYDITLEYHFYDVFGLDNDDEVEYGGAVFDVAEGVTAWWQLQFQYGYAPLVTRGRVQKEFRVIL